MRSNPVLKSPIDRDAEIIGFREKISYGFGDFGYSLSWNMAGAFLLYFYTDVAHLPAAAVGTLFLLARLMDAAIDLGVGLMVDKTRSRWGRTRPYFLFGAAPYCAFIVLTFLAPDFDLAGRLVYAYLTFNFLGILFSFGAVPYSALMPMITRNARDRLHLGSMRSVGTSVSVIVATAATMPLVQLFGGGNPKRGFALVSVLFAAFSMVAILNLFANCRERFHDNSPQTARILPSIGRMLCNRAWLVTFIFTVLNFVRFGAVLSVTAYFAINVLNRPWMISVLLPAVSGTLLLGAFIAPPVLTRTGIRAGCAGAIIAALVLYCALPFTEGSPVLFLAVFLTASVLISLTMTSIFTMAADSVDYHERKYRTRNEGLLSSGISLSTKIGMALGASGVAYTLAAAGYEPQAVSALARSAIRWSYYGWPVAVLLLQLLCIAFWPADRALYTVETAAAPS
jgi:GPH family glycoside/pentoside/hexuronide:cation symporter